MPPSMPVQPALGRGVVATWLAVVGRPVRLLFWHKASFWLKASFWHKAFFLSGTHVQAPIPLTLYHPFRAYKQYDGTALSRPISEGEGGPEFEAKKRH